MTPQASSYDRFPVVPIAEDATACAEGWPEVLDLFHRARTPGRFVLVIDTYPGVLLDPLAKRLRAALNPDLLLLSEAVLHDAAVLQDRFAGTLTADPVFATLQPFTFADLFCPDRVHRQRDQIEHATGLTIVLGPGAAHIAPAPDLLVRAEVARWEIQRRQRAHLVGNLGRQNAAAPASELYKIAFFLDWRIADRHRHEHFSRVDLFLDLNDPDTPRALPGPVLRAAVEATVRRPFRVVPFFDPGPWGGQWMRRTFDLPEGPPNYAWAFDCVPEENSVLLGFGSRRFELPAIVLVHEQPELLLGPIITSRFGAEFPIRFDLLDTVEGGNLSLQVHPSRAYIREHFGMPYTQDESYYMLHSEPGTHMVLGLQEHIDPDSMRNALLDAQAGLAPFPAEDFVNLWPTRTHDHFSIPAGTVHCSGAGSVVLEISATPYIFTFKLWDWDRTGLDGLPRPIHLEHGLANIRWDRTTGWVARELVNPVATVWQGEGWREERTGLHATEFLETRRHWFTAPAPHHTRQNLNVLNLVEGPAAIVSSPTHSFPPLLIHYAETFIVPACAGDYLITPAVPTTTPLATLKAFVRG